MLICIYVSFKSICSNCKQRLCGYKTCYTLSSIVKLENILHIIHLKTLPLKDTCKMLLCIRKCIKVIKGRGTITCLARREVIVTSAVIVLRIVRTVSRNIWLSTAKQCNEFFTASKHAQLHCSTPFGTFI